MVILQIIAAGEVELVSSAVVRYENSRNPFPLRRQWVDRCLHLASHFQPLSENMRARALELEQAGIRAVDALHLVCAEAAESQYFLTCDDPVIRRYQGGMQGLNPINFVSSVTGEQP